MFRSFSFFFLLPFVFLALLYIALSLYLLADIPPFSYQQIEGASTESMERLPFFTLMTPIPKSAQHFSIPQLEYRPGPPKRFFYRLSYFYWKEGTSKERIDYYGRKTEKRWFFPLIPLLSPFSLENYSSFIAASLAYAFQYRWDKKVEGTFLGKLLYLYQAKVFLKEFSGTGSKLRQPLLEVYVMSQAESPAFLLLRPEIDKKASRGAMASIRFYQRESLYALGLRTEKGNFSLLNPKEIFSNSFLLASRKKALVHVGAKLAEVSIKKGVPSAKELELPLLLLGAKLSLEPSSIRALFHFTGLNSLLFQRYRHSQDLEVSDSLRNNVLAAREYARDISPSSKHSREIYRLARLLERL